MNGKCSKRESKYNVLCIRVLLCIIILQHDCLHKLTKIHWDVGEGGGATHICSLLAIWRGGDSVVPSLYVQFSLHSWVMSNVSELKPWKKCSCGISYLALSWTPHMGSSVTLINLGKNSQRMVNLPDVMSYTRFNVVHLGSQDPRSLSTRF